jgi:hypothetical protein
VPENRIIHYSEVETFLKNYLAFLKKKKVSIIILLTVSLFVSLLYWYFQPDKYSSNSTFLIADQKASNSNIANIATQFGFDITSMIGSDANMFYGDNIFDILKSNTIIENALSTNIKNKDGDETLMTLYKKSQDYNSNFIELFLDTQFINIINKIKKKNIIIERTNKKSSILSLTIVSSDPLFSYAFNKEVVVKTTELYKKMKVGNLSANINRLEKKADSIQSILNKRSYQSAKLKSIDVNTAYKVESVAEEISDREKIILNNLYSEIIKNIESLKINLIIQTPVFEFLDKPTYPVKNEKSFILFYMLNGLLIGIVTGALYFLFPFLKQSVD